MFQNKGRQLRNLPNKEWYFCEFRYSIFEDAGKEPKIMKVIVTLYRNYGF